MFRHTVFIFLFFFLVSGVALAGPGGTKFGGHGGINVGGLYWDVSEINEFLDSANMDELPSILPTIGGGGQAILFGGVVIGGRGSVAQYHLGGDYLSVNTAVSYGFMDLGYAIINRERWLMTPVASIGGATFQIEMDGDLSKVGLAKYAANYNPRTPDNAVDDKILMTSSTLIGHIGVATYHQIHFTESEAGAFGGFLVGISTGWIFELTHSGWEIEGEDVRQGPTYSPHGLYLQLELHFGGGVAETDPSKKEAGSVWPRNERKD